MTCSATTFKNREAWPGSGLCMEQGEEEEVKRGVGRVVSLSVSFLHYNVMMRTLLAVKNAYMTLWGRMTMAMLTKTVSHDSWEWPCIEHDKDENGKDERDDG